MAYKADKRLKLVIKRSVKVRNKLLSNLFIFSHLRAGNNHNKQIIKN